MREKNLMEDNFNIKIQYLELRNEKTLSISNKLNKSKIFIAYYLNNVRFGFKFLHIKPFYLGNYSGVFFLALYFLYNIYNYFKL